jgi:hypothetical protein
MIIQFKPSALRQTRWYEYLVRFGLGGAMTVVAGLIAARFGPVIGGLFLAFAAIFPASATLIEKHIQERMEKAGLPGARRGKEAAAPMPLERSQLGCVAEPVPRTWSEDLDDQLWPQRLPFATALGAPATGCARCL